MLMTGIHQVPAPTRIARATTNAIIVYLGGDTNDVQIDATKILLAQGGSLLSTWRYASDLSKIDATKLLGDIAAARMQTNILAGIIAAGGIVDADVAAGAAIAKSKLASLGIVDADVAAGAAIALSKLAGKVKIATVNYTPCLSTGTTGWTDIPNMSLTFTVDLQSIVLYFCEACVSHSTVGKFGWMYCDGDATVYAFYIAAFASTGCDTDTKMWVGCESLAPGTYTRKLKWTTNADRFYAGQLRLTALIIPT